MQLNTVTTLRHRLADAGFFVAPYANVTNVWLVFYRGREVAWFVDDVKRDRVRGSQPWLNQLIVQIELEHLKAC